MDHGKSVLVRGLTGMDPDRLKEEKERGMTIDLGFAWLKLPGGKEVGIIDVPGHERLIKNMLTGVSSIDLVLLVVAANEGVMPQTREHIAVLDLLGIKHGIVVITKKDTVDDDQLEFVKLEIQELLISTSLAGAHFVPVSALTGEGMADLIKDIESSLIKSEPHRDIGRPRLFIDRVFTIAGAGTVVTGTLIDGTLTIGQEVEMVTSGVRTRVRGLQTHKAGIEKAYPGSRVAVNLSGMAVSQVKRGEVLTTPGWLTSTKMINAHLSVVPYLHFALRNNMTISFHSGTALSTAKMRLMDRDEIKAGESAWVQLSLRDPLALNKGDHFVIRSASDTVAGGEVIETDCTRFRKRDRELITRLNSLKEGKTEKSVLATVKNREPIELAGLLRQLNMPSNIVSEAIRSLIQENVLISIGQGDTAIFYSRQGWQELLKRAGDAVNEFHGKYPTRPGMPRAELATKLKLLPQSSIFQEIVKTIFVEEGTLLRLPAHEIRVTAQQRAAMDAFLDSLRKSPFSPPDEKIPEAELLNLLIRLGDVVKVNANIVFSSTAYHEIVDGIVSYINSHGSITVAQVRDMFGTSRKYAQAVLEHMDEEKITRRVGDTHVPRHQA